MARWTRRATLCLVAASRALLCPNVPAAEYALEVPPAPVDRADLIARRDWLHWWVFDINPSFSAETVYDDNVNIGSVDQQKDLIWVASPAFTAIAGDPLAGDARLLTISYVPSFVLFSQYDQYNSIDHAASISGIWPFSRLTLGFRQTFDENNGGVVDVGNRVERQIYNTGLTSSYELSEKTSFEINAHQLITDYPSPLISTHEWYNENWLNYVITAKVVLGLGLTFGYVDVDQYPAQTYEKILLRAVYKLTYKVDLNAAAGGEFRQYDQGPDGIGPVFSLGGTYWPTESTSLSIEGHRDNRNSALLAGQNYISTGIAFNGRQRFLERYFVTLGASYEHADYRSAINGVVATRADDYYLVQSGVDFAINLRWMVGVFFRHRENTSNESFGFTNNQLGLQTSFHF